MSIKTQTYVKKDGSVSVYTREWEHKSRTTHILVPNGLDRPFFAKLPDTSILFNDKDYPTCLGCSRKYLHELGCLWCSIERNGRNCGTDK